MLHCENINIFGCLGGQGQGASIIKLGPYWFTFYPLIYINLHVKYGSDLIRTFRVKIKKYKIFDFCIQIQN